MYDILLLNTGLIVETPKLALRQAWNYTPVYECSANLLCERTHARHKAMCPSTAKYVCQCYNCDKGGV